MHTLLPLMQSRGAAASPTNERPLRLKGGGKSGRERLRSIPLELMKEEERREDGRGYGGVFYIGRMVR
jgi:hypothetical protein